MLRTPNNTFFSIKLRSGYAASPFAKYSFNANFPQSDPLGFEDDHGVPEILGLVLLQAAAEWRITLSVAGLTALTALEMHRGNFRYRYPYPPKILRSVLQQHLVGL